MLSQVGHDQIDKLNLVGSESLACQKGRHSLLRRAAIHSDERTNEQTQALRFLLRPSKIVGITKSTLAKHAFQLSEISRC